MQRRKNYSSKLAIFCKVYAKKKIMLYIKVLITPKVYWMLRKKIVHITYCTANKGPVRIQSSVWFQFMHYQNWNWAASLFPKQNNTVKASNFVILFNENIFFRRFFLRLPQIIFQYWNRYRKCLATGWSYFSILLRFRLEFLFFCRVTKLEDRPFISSPFKVG